MKTEFVEIKLPSIEGFVYTGEYREPENGEYYIYDYGDGIGTFKYMGVRAQKEVFILKKIEPAYKKFKPSHDCSLEYVEMQALVDALDLSMVASEEMTNSQCDKYNSLMELIK